MRNENDRKRTGQACFIGLQEALDSLDHEVLLKKTVYLRLRRTDA